MFNVEKNTNNIINYIREYYKKNNLGGCVLGISGGKDSAVVAAIMCASIGAENVLGVTLPCHSKNQDKTDALLVSEAFGFELVDLDLTDAFEAIKDKVNLLGEFTEEETLNSDINLKPRLRMSAVYYLAALKTALTHKTYIVAGTSNKSELFVGYFTKGGDSVHDIGVLTDFTVDEVIKIGEYLNVPEKVLYKTPSDGLSNKSDEEKLGVTYKDIKKFMNGEELPEYVSDKIKKLHNNAAHKFNLPYYKQETCE